jgi:hypothetical protein
VLYAATSAAACIAIDATGSSSIRQHAILNSKGAPLNFCATSDRQRASRQRRKTASGACFVAAFVVQWLLQSSRALTVCSALNDFVCSTP